MTHGARAIVFSGREATCLEGGEMDFDPRGTKGRLVIDSVTYASEM